MGYLFFTKGITPKDRKVNDQQSKDKANLKFYLEHILKHETTQNVNQEQLVLLKNEHCRNLNYYHEFMNYLRYSMELDVKDSFYDSLHFVIELTYPQYSQVCKHFEITPKIAAELETSSLEKQERTETKISDYEQPQGSSFSH